MSAAGLLKHRVFLPAGVPPLLPLPHPHTSAAHSGSTHPTSSRSSPVCDGSVCGNVWLLEISGLVFRLSMFVSCPLHPPRNPPPPSHPTPPTDSNPKLG